MKGSAPSLPDEIRLSGEFALRGSIRTPGDKSISHRVILLGALATGTTVARGLSDGEDVRRTIGAASALGAEVVVEAGEVRISGGRRRLHRCDDLDCGNSGTTMRLLAGVLAGLPWATTLFGDDSLSARPMDRVAAPLTAMGARLEGRGPKMLPPLVVEGGPLQGIDWTASVASAQVKSAILLAGLQAEGPTVVREPVSTRAHTEELLELGGAEITVTPWERGRVVRLLPSELRPLNIDVPGDPSQAAFWVVAGCILPDSEVVVEKVYGGVDRTGFMRVLERMGAYVEQRQGNVQGVSDILARYGPLVGTSIDAADIPSLDEVPALAVAATVAEGTSVFHDVGELRVKETDRLAAVAGLVNAFGGHAEAKGDDLVIQGVGPSGHLLPGTFDSKGDHRLAMAAAVAALSCGSGGASVIRGFSGVATSYPRFLADLDALAGRHVTEASGS